MITAQIMKNNPQSGFVVTWGFFYALRCLKLIKTEIPNLGSSSYTSYLADTLTRNRSIYDQNKDDHYKKL